MLTHKEPGQRCASNIRRQSWVTGKTLVLSEVHQGDNEVFNKETAWIVSPLKGLLTDLW